MQDWTRSPRSKLSKSVRVKAVQVPLVSQSRTFSTNLRLQVRVLRSKAVISLSFKASLLAYQRLISPHLLEECIIRHSTFLSTSAWSIFWRDGPGSLAASLPTSLTSSLSATSRCILSTLVGCIKDGERLCYLVEEFFDIYMVRMLKNSSTLQILWLITHSSTSKMESLWYQRREGRMYR